MLAVQYPYSSGRYCDPILQTWLQALRQAKDLPEGHVIHREFFIPSLSVSKATKLPLKMQEPWSRLFQKGVAKPRPPRA